eukprot:gene6246-biopygen7329
MKAWPVLPRAAQTVRRAQYCTLVDHPGETAADVDRTRTGRGQYLPYVKCHPGGVHGPGQPNNPKFVEVSPPKTT